MKVLKFPLARITICFVLGLSAAFLTKPFPEKTLIFAGISVILLSLVFLLNKKFRVPHLYGIVACFSFFILGFSALSIHSEYFYQNHFLHFVKDEKQVFKLVIREQLKNSASGSRFVTEVKQVEKTETEGKLLVTINHPSKEIKIGDEYFVIGKFLPHRKITNPYQFDYGNYLHNKSISGQIFLEETSLINTGETKRDIYYYAANFRIKIINNLKKSGFNPDALAVLSALILGQQQEISKEILQDYQFAGAVHILSVSGLHVGCLMLIITFLLKPLPNTRFYNFFRLIFVISFLWIFTLIAGFSPSVVRSVVMFSFVAVGQFSIRKTNLLHTLLVSMLLILLFKPSFLVDVGFQLSYSALFFIAWLQPKFDTFWQPENKILKYFYQIITVSFAAQLGTLPFCLYYFHQFPGLFLVTNLVVLPVIGGIMGLGLLVMILAFFDLIWKPLSVILETAILWMNKIIHLIASVDVFLFKEIHFNLMMLFASVFLVFAIGFWIHKHSFKNMATAMTSIVLFQIICLFTVVDSKNINETIVFSDRKNLILAENNGSEVTIKSRDSVNEKNLSFAIKPYTIATVSKIKSYEKFRNVVFSQRQKILVLDSTSVASGLMKPDILIVSHSPKLNFERIIANTKPKVVIADASNYKNFVERLSQTCEKAKIPFHSIYEKGFYTIVE